LHPPIENPNQQRPGGRHNFTFPNSTIAIRSTEAGGRRGVLGTDLCKLLGIDNPHAFYGRLAADEKGYASRASLGLPAGKPMIVIFESGINKAILRSNKAEAQPYIEWVTRDVLPAIRKDGAYGSRGCARRLTARLTAPFRTRHVTNALHGPRRPLSTNL
jgi:prophage antirepressor-like protein